MLNRVTFNDIYSAFLTMLVFSLWAVDGVMKTFTLPEVVNGAFIAWVGLIVQYYYRKARNRADNRN